MFILSLNVNYASFGVYFLTGTRFVHVPVYPRLKYQQYFSIYGVTSCRICMKLPLVDFFGLVISLLSLQSSHLKFVAELSVVASSTYERFRFLLFLQESQRLM